MAPMNASQVQVKKLTPTAQLPLRAHADDAGADLFADESVTLLPGHRALISTGIAIALPHGTVGLVHPRSGLAFKKGLSIVNAPGTVDAGYRGELKVCLINLDPETPVEIHQGDRIAQLVIQQVELSAFTEVDSLDDTARGMGGHGSTGT